MSTIKVVHSTDIGAGLEVVAGKLIPDASMATDAEVSSVVSSQAALDAKQNSMQAAADAAQDAALQAFSTETATTMGVMVANQANTDRAQDTALAAAVASQDIARVTDLGAVRAELEGSSLALQRKIAAQAALTGLYDVTLSGNSIKITMSPFNSGGRLIVMGAGKNGRIPNGYVDLFAPAAGATIKGLGCADVTVDAAGFIPIPFSWNTLFVNMYTGEWYHSTYSQGTYEVSPELLFVGQINHDPVFGVTFKTADGRVCYQGFNGCNTGWMDLPFEANVTNYGYGYQTCQYRRVENRVYVRGLCEAAGTGIAGAAEVKLARLPEGFRPPARVIKVVNHHEGSSRIDITAEGNVTHMTSNTGRTWYPLEFDFAV